MKALLLAAGKATRLGRLSVSTPKCLHRVGNEILLDRIIRQLREAGATEFLINTHHLADQVSAHIDLRPDRAKFKLAYEPELLGTLGTLRENSSFFDNEPFWVLHADNFIQGSFAELLASFSQKGAGTWGSLLTFEVNNPNDYGVVTSDDRGVLTGFFEKVDSPPSREASAATFIFSSTVLDLICNLPVPGSDISRDLMPHLIGRLQTFRHTGQVIDIGSPIGLKQARRLAQVDGLVPRH